MSTTRPTLEIVETAPKESPPIILDEEGVAKFLDVSLGWVRKDRRTPRYLPFYRMCGHIRYNVHRVLEALAAVEEGGAHLKPRTRATRASA